MCFITRYHVQQHNEIVKPTRHVFQKLSVIHAGKDR